MVTMKDVAKSAGVSVMTVSRAFQSDSSVHEQTRNRIRTIADQMGYIFDSNAASFRSQKTNFVAMTIPSINNANFADTVGSLSEKLAENGMQVLLGYSGYDMNREEKLFEQLLSRRPEAIVVTGGRHTERGRTLLKNAGIPVIEIWDFPEDPIQHVVGFSNAEAVHGTVQHLIETGCRRIAFLGGNTFEDTRGAERRSGFISAMKKHGLPADRLIDVLTPPMTMQSGAIAMSELLETYPDSDAVICVSDLGAFGALSECQRRGISVPNDIAIAGFGAFEIASVCVPTLTTVDSRSHEIGSKTADLILDIFQAKDEVKPTRIKIDWELKLGGSTQRT